MVDNDGTRSQVVENWTFSLFFCVAELWGAVVISVLFWTLANEVRAPYGIATMCMDMRTSVLWCHAPPYTMKGYPATALASAYAPILLSGCLFHRLLSCLMKDAAFVC